MARRKINLVEVYRKGRFMGTNSSSSSNGIGFTGLLTVLFIGLKLTGHIDWSWLWVLSPIWISFLLVFGLIGGFVLFTYISDRIKSSKRKRFYDV